MLRRSSFALATGVLVALAACVGGDPVPGESSSGGTTDASTDGAGSTGDGGPVVKGPRSTAAGLVYRDSDVRQGFLGGDVVVKKAADESDVVEYRIYFGKSDAAKLVGSPVGTSPARGVDVTIAVPKDTPLPPEATHLLVFTANAEGENPAPKAIALRDNFFEERTLAIGAAPLKLRMPSAAIDAKNARVVLAGLDATADKLSLVLCDRALAACTLKDASVGLPSSATRSPTLLVDTVNDKLIAIRTEVTAGVSAPGYTACNLDGTACVTKDVTAGHPNQNNPHATIDPVGKRLYIAQATGAAASRLSLVHCALDGTGCVFVDVGNAVGAGDYSAGTPSVMVDAKDQKLLVVTNDITGSYLLHLYRCNLQGTGCVLTDANAGQPDGSGDFPRGVFDEASGQILTVTRNTVNPANKQASLFRCDPKDAKCTHANVSAGEQKAIAAQPSVAVFSPAGSLFFFVRDEAQSRASLFRCNTDGTSCTHWFLSAATGFADEHTIAIDPATERVYVAAYNGTAQTTQVFTFLAW